MSTEQGDWGQAGAQQVTNNPEGLAETILSLRFEAMPVWVDASRIAYLDDRSGVMHLYVGDISTGERRHLTGGAERIQSLLAARGSSTVLVGTDTGGNERQQLVTVDVDTGERKDLTVALERMHEPFVLSGDGSLALFRTNDGASGEFSLYRIDLRTGDTAVVWDDAGQVRAHDIAEDGRMLVSILTSNLDADLYLVGRDGHRRPVLQVDDESWILDAAFLPGGEHALVLTNAGSDFVALHRIHLESRQLHALHSPDADIELMALSSDGRHLAWSENHDGYSVVRLGSLDALEQAPVAALPDGVADRISWSPDGDRVAVGWTPVDRPARIHVVERDGQVTQAFPDEVGDVSFTGRAPELITFATFDERDIPAFWFEAESPNAPVVIDVHGGPESQRRAGFHPVLQLLAAAGFHVLSTNVRGSTGYGKAYSHLDDVVRRMDSVRDLWHAHAWVRDRLGDDARVAIVGQSYGGFMTLAAVTEYPDLWFAAVDVVGISNFVTFLERTGPWRRRHRSAEYGSLERDRALLERISPIRKVGEIQAPMLVIHGRNDPRVPLHEAEQLVESLERRGHRVDLLVFDDEGHGLSKRPNRIVGYARTIAFLWDVAPTEPRT